MTTVTITINGQEVKAQAGQTVMQAAETAGIDVPKLCDHPKLNPIGACRLCLVEIEKQRTLQPACTFPVSEGLVIHTESPKVVDARKFVLNLLFSERNHFCMFCQMSGNCTLQDMAYRYNLDHWLFNRGYPKLPVDSTRRYFVMDHNRCILCRRCIRACSDLVGNHTLGLRHRGFNSMLVADMDVPFGDSSCISCGTCLQVCPTGALMDRTSAYGGVEEEVQRVKTACQFCSVGCGAEMVVRDNHVIRIEGDWEDTLNGGLLCVRGRFEPLYETATRVTKPMIRKEGQLVEASWDEALQFAADRLAAANGKMGIIVSDRVTNEVAALVAQIFGTGDHIGAMTALPAHLTKAEGDLTQMDGADLFVVVGTDLTEDHIVAGYPVKRGVTNQGARLVLIAGAENGMAPIAYAEYGPAEIEKVITLAQQASRPVVIYGPNEGEELSALRKGLGSKAQFVGLAPGVNMRGLQTAGLAKAIDLSGAKTVYVLASDSKVDEGLAAKLEKADFIILQGSYMSPVAHQADVILPSTLWAEKAGSITNTEGRQREVAAAVVPPDNVRSDEAILKGLALKMGIKVS